MQASRFHPRLQYRALDGGSQTFGAGKGSRTGSGRSFARITLRVHGPDMGLRLAGAKAKAGYDRLAVGNLRQSGVFSFAECRLILAPTRRGDRDAH